LAALENLRGSASERRQGDEKVEASTAATCHATTAPAAANAAAMVRREGEGAVPRNMLRS
jgi:hypothetical protein